MQCVRQHRNFGFGKVTDRLHIGNRWMLLGMQTYYADGAYHFNITDYQGNIRAVIREDGTLEDTNNYYPYGGLMGSGSMGVQPYKYGGKELDRENGLDLYDSHARMYDPIIGRTTTIDPLAEKYTHLSPYLWCAANPLKYVDPSGMVIYIANNLRGAIENIAMIGATTLGRNIVNTLIKTKIHTFKLKSVIIPFFSEYIDRFSEIKYTKYRFFGHSAYDMAHEMMHAYDYLNHFRPVTKDKRDKGEDRAVSFRNYICNEYNDDSNVDNYGLRKNGNFNMYYKHEIISNFMFLDDKDGKYGFSYEVKPISNNSYYKSSNTYYLIVKVNESRRIDFEIFNNKKDYDKIFKGK